MTPTFPLLGPLGLLPAPTKWRIVFGELDRGPVRCPRLPTTRSSSGGSPRSARHIQTMLDRGVEQRAIVWLG